MLLDVDGTLYHQPPLRLLMAGELAFLPVRLRSFAAARRVWRILKVFRKEREELRQPADSAALLDELQYAAPAACLGVDAAQVKAVVEEWMYRRPLKYLKRCRRDGLVDFLAFLHTRRIPAGVFSDYPADEKLEALGISKYVSLRLCATERTINAFKPEPSGFRYACELWGLEPSEVLYVGDRPEVDAAGAAACGMACAIIGKRTHRSKEPVSGQYMGYTSFRALQEAMRSAA